MFPLALFLADSGHDLSAEDDALSDEARKLLEQRGVAIRQFVEDESAALVYSSAISPDHPARAYARRTGSVAMRRGECLAVIAREKKLIAISGSHGKTTTCGMLIDMLDGVGFGFDFLLGAQFENRLPYRADGNDWLVAEVDESDGTIDLFSPEICVIVNVDHDHHALYQTEAEYFAVFDRLMQRTRREAIIDASSAAAFEQAAGLSKARLVTFGPGGDCWATSREAGAGWSAVQLQGAVELNDLRINRVGRVNSANAGFAALAAMGAGGSIAAGMAFEFQPIKRRQSYHYNSPSVQIFEDYAHHPREIDAVLERLGAKEGWRTIVVFQPHRYSRTRELKAEFAASLAACEELVLLDVYAASEAPLEGGSGGDLFEACRQTREQVDFVPSESELLDRLVSEAGRAKTRIVFLGAGVGDRLARQLSMRIGEREPRWGSVYRDTARSCGFEAEIRADEPLANKTTLRLGGPAERYFEPASLNELTAALEACHRAGIEARVIGRGSNLVVPDQGVPGMVIRLSHPIWSRFEALGDGLVRVGAGLRIKVLCGQACKEGLRGFEFLEGIPGCVGGVLRMNAGAMGGWVFDVVKSVRYVTKRGDVIEAEKRDLSFGYRFCRELEAAVAIDAVFQAGGKGDSQDEIRRTIDSYQSRRKESQPREPSAGCIFKNPEGTSAGRVIDELGLKGTVVGGAEISGTHGNFIINRGGATSADVIELVKLTRRVAREKRGLELQPEALLFGASWEEVLR